MLVLRTSSDIFDMAYAQGDAICITTNGMVKRNGRAVMGKGIAKQANDKFGLDKALGKYISAYGNVCHYLGRYELGLVTVNIISYPTKEHWRNPSDLGLIERSAHQLVRIVDSMDINSVTLPPPGCGCGGRDWEREIRTILESCLDDRFTVLLKE